MTQEISFDLGDLVYYVGPPIVNPINWHLIVENDNGIISKEDIGLIIKADLFLHIANVFFQQNKITIERIAFKYLKHVS